MKVRNLFAVLAAVGILGLVADTASAQVNVTPGGATVTGPAGNNLNVPFNGQTPSVTPGSTTVQPGTAGTFTQPGTYTQPGFYPGSGTYPGTTYYQPMYGSNSYYQQPYMANGYSYYTPGQQWGTTSSYYPQAAVAGGGCCGASITPVGYNAPAAGGCCGASYAQPISYGGGGCGCDPCAGGRHRRGLFRR